MLKNYLATAFRNLLKRRSHAAIVVLGLSIGLAAAILIFLYLRYETGYDAFHAKADRLARLALVESYSPQERFVNAQTPLPMGPAIVERFPEAVRFARVFASERFVRAPGSEALVSER